MMITTRPSRASMREVKREHRDRQRRRRAAEREAWRPYVEARRRKRARRSIIVLACVAVLVSLAWSATDVMRGGAPLDTPRAVGAEGSTPSPTASSRTSDSPFTGSPVENWPEDLGGVTAQPATRTGDYTAAQTADAFARARTYLRASMLDRRVLFRAALGPVRRALDRDSAQWLSTLARKPTTTRNPLHIVTRFDPDLVRPDGQTAKVRGRMRAYQKRGYLAVDYDVVVVHALRSADGGSSRLVAVRRDGTLWFSTRPGSTRTVTAPFFHVGGYLNSGDVCDGQELESAYLRVVWEDRSTGGSATPADETHNALDLDEKVEPGEGCYVDTSGL